MSADPATEITILLNKASSGERASYDRLAELVHGELRKMASKLMSGERRNHTLQPTIIAHDAYLSLIDSNNQNWQNRAHFFAVAARAMRRILVDHGRRRQAQKRWGEQQRVDLSEAAKLSVDGPEEVLAVDEVLTRLEDIDARQAQIVELRYFGGLTEQEVAEVMEISARTVKREWQFAKLWLYAELAALAARPTSPRK